MEMHNELRQNRRIIFIIFFKILVIKCLFVCIIKINS
jgi:hypothetical protein